MINLVSFNKTINLKKNASLQLIKSFSLVNRRVESRQQQQSNHVTRTEITTHQHKTTTKPNDSSARTDSESIYK